MQPCEIGFICRWSQVEIFLTSSRDTKVMLANSMHRLTRLITSYYGQIRNSAVTSRTGYNQTWPDYTDYTDGLTVSGCAPCSCRKWRGWECQRRSYQFPCLRSPTLQMDIFFAAFRIWLYQCMHISMSQTETISECARTLPWGSPWRCLIGWWE